MVLRHFNAFPLRKDSKAPSHKKTLVTNALLKKRILLRDLDILRTKYKKQCLSYLRSAKSKGLYEREFKFSKLLGKVIIQNQTLTIWGKKAKSMHL